MTATDLEARLRNIHDKAGTGRPGRTNVTTLPGIVFPTITAEPGRIVIEITDKRTAQIDAAKHGYNHQWWREMAAAIDTAWPEPRRAS